MDMKINLIACMDSKHGIGKDNKMPWPHFKADMKRFRSLTIENTILMGRKTHESIGCILDSRFNIVLSSNRDSDNPINNRDNAASFFELDGAIDFARQIKSDLFIIGGQSIYEQTIDIADTIYLTKICKDYDCDRFFPEISHDDWEATEIEVHNDEGFCYDFVKLGRIRK